MVARPREAAPFRILVVCTANICRSVMAEHLLRREIEARGLGSVSVGSCGLLFDDEPASDTVLAVLSERGIDVTGHRSRHYTTEMVADADLVVTMERQQARELAVSIGGASPRIHTLGALVTWLDGADDITGSPADRVAAGAAAREPSALLGTGHDEVDDPHGRSKRVHRKAADRIELLAIGLLDGLYGPRDDD